MPEQPMEEKCELVKLEPFVHQVAGQSSMLLFNPTTVCKPLNPREHQFYETLPHEMKDFIPLYKGVIKVTCQEDRDGYITLVGYKAVHKMVKPDASSSPSSCGEAANSDSSDSDSSQSSSGSRVRLRRNGSIELVGGKAGVFEAAGTSSKDSKILAGQNPWGLRCHREQLAKMKVKGRESSNVHKFILLENVASKFLKPCILDLKMGTRQHGDDATKEKREQQIVKCASTTSRSLGMRICGMQVYQVNTGKYICHNKFYGRQLEENGFEHALYQFFHNGASFQRHLLEPLLKQLQSLYKVLSRQNTFRYYSSSLLLIYDGVNSVIDNRSEEDHKTEDRAHHDNDRNDTQHGKTAVRSAASHEVAAAHNSSEHCQARKPCGCVDLRMIDFAHTTHQGFRGDHKVHSGPDRGYLFGLENLMRMLQNLLEEDS